MDKMSLMPENCGLIVTVIQVCMLKYYHVLFKITRTAISFLLFFFNNEVIHTYSVFTWYNHDVYVQTY